MILAFQDVEDAGREVFLGFDSGAIRFFYWLAVIAIAIFLLGLWRALRQVCPRVVGIPVLA